MKKSLIFFFVSGEYRFIEDSKLTMLIRLERALGVALISLFAIQAIYLQVH